MAIKIEDVYNLCTSIDAKLVQIQAVQNSHTALLNGLVTAGQQVGASVESLRGAVGQSEDGASLHSVAEATQDVLSGINNEVQEIAGKLEV